jgi:hypothetical protein
MQVFPLDKVECKKNQKEFCVCKTTRRVRCRYVPTPYSNLDNFEAIRTPSHYLKIVKNNTRMYDTPYYIRPESPSRNKQGFINSLLMIVICTYSDYWYQPEGVDPVRKYHQSVILPTKIRTVLAYHSTVYLNMLIIFRSIYTV